MMYSKKNQLGISVLEVLISLAVIGLIIAGAVGLGSGAFSSQNTVGMTQEVSSIRNATKGLYSKSTSFGTASMNSVLIDAKAFPDYLKIDTTTSTVTNSFGGTITVTGATANFTIGYTAVPKDICIKHIAQAGSGGLVSVAVNGGTALPVPVSPTAAQTACNTATNSLVWTAS
jgi:Tfp pilus assembly protein PilV